MLIGPGLARRWMSGSSALAGPSVRVGARGSFGPEPISCRDAWSVAQDGSGRLQRLSAIRRSASRRVSISPGLNPATSRALMVASACMTEASRSWTCGAADTSTLRPSAGFGSLWIRPAVSIFCSERVTCCGSGPSPRVRGSLMWPGCHMVQTRSIPACAGEPPIWPPMLSGCWVHPRVCGGASSKHKTERLKPGPSPRVRGSQTAVANAGIDIGSIPACAGEPCSWLFSCLE